jgi:hypothetical protein
LGVDSRNFIIGMRREKLMGQIRGVSTARKGRGEAGKARGWVRRIDPFM